MDCPHCKKTIEWQIVIEEIRKALRAHPGAAALATAGKTEDERSGLVAWLERWRQDCGLAPADLKRRSTDQLRKMFAQAQIGSSYRAGRKWKTASR